ncbi:Acg family FMN-binding oxidoreductase [Pseudoxanthomonas wuyuanensis]|uniref:Tat pathway signal protein n=1 Tax=Pseudoxanthomonas wuyuanensis TaxID=1073196 RepID=A0A286CYM1_9GAMM|nr:Tat pathway signal protein [Pseudoxanthomonas wuyuanensis]KAF1722822.1 Tat pathway signal protein [Pseudoxanthomonas wuyuanensis]SOD51501.1 hypothetical protein SAMN06296416_101654 [Pseudoxanthomonas wuyuanensis]
MLSRRLFLGNAAAAAASVAASGCTVKSESESYDAAVQRTWRHRDGHPGDPTAVLRELVRYATLAPSSHNTQCWKFSIGDGAVAILPDFSRRCPAVDPDDHHLFVSLGCAAENLAQAAMAHGLMAESRFRSELDGALDFALMPTRAIVSPLFQAIPERQCTRSPYDGTPLSGPELTKLELAGSGEGVQVLLFTESSATDNILDYVVQGNTAQMHDPAFIDELKAWIRFNEDEAVRTGDGLFTGATGNPTAPRWLGSRLFDLFLTPQRENDKYAAQVRSSAVIAVFVSEHDDREHWIEAGRCYQRFALQATALGIRNAFLNQPVEVAALRPQFGGFLGIGERRADLVVRFGRGQLMPRSLRRPMQAVLI